MWHVKREIGIEYGNGSNGQHAQRLNSPAFAERMDGGLYLVVDELAREKGIPFRIECRTIQLNSQCNIVFDSKKMGFDDGYGCGLDDGSIALLRRSRWEILIIAPAGQISGHIDLSTFSKLLPRFISKTYKNTLLVTFFERGTVDIIETDLQGRFLWCLPKTGFVPRLPGSSQLLENGNILVSDEVRHTVTELDPDGRIVWQWGESNDPSSQQGHLWSPKSVMQADDGRRLIADMRNHRVLAIGTDGLASQLRPRNSEFCDPSFASLLPDGHYIVCDSGNRRVVEMDSRRSIVWQYGADIERRRFLSLPRSIETDRDGQILIADTGNDRVVKIRENGIETWPVQGDLGLFWPRCARLLKNGSILVADGRHSRIIEISAQGQVVNQLYSVGSGGGMPIEDPHDVHMLPNGNILLVDSMHDAVVETDWSGQVHWQVGGGAGEVELKDPHSAQMISNGLVLITDVGNSRILFVDRHGGSVKTYDGICSGASFYKFHLPRYAEYSQCGILVVVDTGNNRILAVDPAGQMIWEISKVPDSPIPLISQPRWVHIINSHELLVCDHYHHRLLHLAYRQGA